jgi:NDP-hexose-3-ketoreductase
MSLSCLILGYSSIARRRVIPALGGLDGVDCIDVASLSKKEPADWPKSGKLFSSYETALADSQAELVYVSLPNALHERWIEAALASGRHVVVDKPAALSLAAAERLLALAAAKNLLLAEATVFNSHPQFAALAQDASTFGPLTHIVAQFMIPPLPAGNFRTRGDMGGGCLADMGPYAAAVARLFGDELETLCCLPAPRYADTDIDMGFSLAARFRNGLRYVGHFSFETEYQNSLTVIGRNGAMTTDRVFSPPPDMPMTWQMRVQNVATQRIFDPCDTFQLFFRKVLAALAAKGHAPLRNDMLSDAVFRHALQQVSQPQ